MTDEANIDQRLRAVESGLAVLSGEVKEARLDIHDLASDSRVAPRRETCPHNEDFVQVLAALEAGGKRFGAIEGELKRAVAERKATTENHEQRLGHLEEEWMKAVQSYRTARWMIGLVAAALGWLARDLLPLLDLLGK